MKARVRVSDKGTYLVCRVTKSDGAVLAPFAITKLAFDDLPFFERLIAHKINTAKVLRVCPTSTPEPTP